MCIQYVSKYPCEHIKARWELCSKAKAANLLRLGKPGSPCDRSAKKDEPPNLQETCGSTCLTRPYRCNKCNSPRKQLAWHCTDCKAIRDNSVRTWGPCECPRHLCGESVIGTSLCKRCVVECANVSIQVATNANRVPGRIVDDVNNR
ncbi:hypothetical protein F5B21DRAFT_29246 [Xylaria acuta]|nr:hypothetical protein F5B21DRAFT_29246 [Xylaria acuta]